MRRDNADIRLQVSNFRGFECRLIDCSQPAFMYFNTIEVGFAFKMRYFDGGSQDTSTSLEAISFYFCKREEAACNDT